MQHNGEVDVLLLVLFNLISPNIINNLNNIKIFRSLYAVETTNIINKVNTQEQLKYNNAKLCLVL